MKKTAYLFLLAALIIFSLTIVYAQEDAGSASGAGTNMITTGGETGMRFFGRAMCRELTGVRGYYDIRTIELIMENENCSNGKMIYCLKSSTEGWYDSNRRLVLAQTCPNYINQAGLKEAVREKNRIKFTNKTIECPDSCTCSGSTIKCTLANGREMTITAGNSGNVIVQIKGENMTTSVTLYKSGDKVYGVFNGNETKIIRIFPDKIKEKIREELKARLQKENITLGENGSYEYEAEKDSKLLFLINVKKTVRAEIDPETGEVKISETKKWWNFLSRDIKEQPSSMDCSESTDLKDSCCQNKGYDTWEDSANQCIFA